MDVFLVITGGILLLVGLIGCILPILPGVVMSYIGIILLHLSAYGDFSVRFLVFWAVVVMSIQVLDFLIPAWGTKKYGGSRLGVLGSLVGVFFGMFFMPVGIVVGPLIGALVGELIAGKNSTHAFRAAFGSLVGFLLGTVSKLIVAGFLIYYYAKTLLVGV